MADVVKDGIDLADYPKVEETYNKLSAGIKAFNATACVLARAQSAALFSCGIEVLTAKLSAQTLGLELSTAATKAGG